MVFNLVLIMQEIIGQTCEEDVEVDISLIDSCFPQDESLVKQINTANADLDTADFSFFNLELSSAEFEALGHIKVTSPHNWGLFDDEAVYLPAAAESYVRRFALDSNDAEYAPIIADLIVRSARAIISEVSDSYKIMLHAFRYASDWHLDKTFDEIVGTKNSDTSLVYIISFHGPSTIFYSANDTMRATCVEGIQEWPSTYGLPAMNSINVSTVSPELGYGSIHKGGKSHGTIHSNPSLEPKFVMAVLPDKRDTVLAMRAFETLHHT